MTAAAPGPTAGQAASEENTWKWLAHLSGLLGFIGPLIVWLVQRDKSPDVATQAKEALNFQLTVAIATTALFLVGGILTFVFVGIALVIAASFLPLVGVAFAIIAAVAAHRTGAYRYPLAVRLVK